MSTRKRRRRTLKFSGELARPIKLAGTRDKRLRLRYGDAAVSSSDLQNDLDLLATERARKLGLLFDHFGIRRPTSFDDEEWRDLAQCLSGSGKRGRPSSKKCAVEVSGIEAAELAVTLALRLPGFDFAYVAGRPIYWTLNTYEALLIFYKWFRSQHPDLHGDDLYNSLTNNPDFKKAFPAPAASSIPITLNAARKAVRLCDVGHELPFDVPQDDSGIIKLGGNF